MKHLAVKKHDKGRWKYLLLCLFVCFSSFYFLFFFAIVRNVQEYLLRKWVVERKANRLMLWDGAQGDLHRLPKRIVPSGPPRLPKRIVPNGSPRLPKRIVPSGPLRFSSKSCSSLGDVRFPKRIVPKGLASRLPNRIVPSGVRILRWVLLLSSFARFTWDAQIPSQIPSSSVIYILLPILSIAPFSHWRLTYSSSFDSASDEIPLTNFSAVKSQLIHWWNSLEWLGKLLPTEKQW